MKEKTANNEKIQYMICINCPRGCRINVVRSEAGWTVSGNECTRGESYALQELTDPQRILTVLMRPEGSEKPVSVRTDRPVPKAKLMECVERIYAVHPKTPSKAGDVLMEDLCGTGARVIATRSAK